MFIIDKCVTVVGDRLVTINESNDIEVRFVHTGQVVHTFGMTDCIWCITSVPGHSDLLVTCDDNGSVDLWDKGAHACECMNVKTGVHVRQIMEVDTTNLSFVASSTRLMCSYGNPHEHVWSPLLHESGNSTIR
jgi:WD40 repeat protein